MTPFEKIRQKIVHMVTGETVPAADVHARYCQLLDNPETEDARYDSERQLRCSGVPTGLQADSSRHYSSQAVAAEMLDGSWVGWTYWHGGGKHGEPAEMPWMETAYEVESFTVVETVRKFRKIPG